jgi:acyl-CoA thioester hydrolase
MKTHTVTQSVRYAETDRMQVVHHSTYPLWFEVGRTGLLSAAGFPYDKLERDGTLFPVVEYSCRITGSADFGDTVEIETGVSSVRSRSVEFFYTVTNRNAVIARGKTTHVAADRERKAKRLPGPLLEALREYARVTNGSENR